VHLFGHPARMDELRRIAEQHGLVIIEDAAQAIGATWHGEYAGAMGAAGVLSLNRHKIIQCGEGGVVLSRDASVARIAAMIRNHGEVVVDVEGGDPFNTLGSNYRMTEVEAAIARVQIDKLDHLLEARQRLAGRLTARLADHPALEAVRVTEGCTSAHYLYPIRIPGGAVEGVGRDAIAAALAAEGVAVATGYVKPIYLQPLYQQRLGRGRRGCPWTCGHWGGEVSYAPGLCPVTERLYDSELMVVEGCRAPATESDIDDIADAFDKVMGRLDELHQPAVR
jgi:perosamine synthetase